jgi:hypothetical protein
MFGLGDVAEVQRYFLRLPHSESSPGHCEARKFQGLNPRETSGDTEQRKQQCLELFWRTPGAPIKTWEEAGLVLVFD